MKTLNLVDLDKSDIKYQISSFPDGQQQITIDNKTCFELTGAAKSWAGRPVVQIKSRLNNWLDLELIICTVASLHELDVKEIHLYTPYIVGARSDRKFEDGGNNYLKDVICPVLNSLKLDSITCLDPHSDVLEACLNNFNKKSNIKLIELALNDGILGEGKVKKEGSIEWIKENILVSPDAGASKKIYKLAEQIGYKGNIITCSKDRDNEGKLTKTVFPSYLNPSILEKDFIIIDDICDGGATFINIARELKIILDSYKKTGLKPGKIYLIVTHGIFSKGIVELSKYFDGIYCTNSYKDIIPPLHYTKQRKFIVEKVKQLNIF